MKRAAALVALLGLGLSGLIAAGSTPFQRDSSPTGTASLRGVVIADDSGRPMRGARISLSGGPLRADRNAITDDAGRFVLSALPAGRFALKASKTGFVAMEYGQSKPRRPGTPVDLADRQSIDDLVLRLPRGAVITGTILDENGDPAPGTQVRVMRYERLSGERRLVEVAADQADDRAVYRVYGLPGGEYLVSAVPRLNVGDMNQTIRDTPGLAAARASKTPGAALLASFLSAVDPDERPVGYAPIFYPGTATAADAAVVTVTAGEERGGVDVPLRLVGVSRIDGMVSSADSPVEGTSVFLVDATEPRAGTPPPGTAIAAPDGRFGFTRIVPGTYTVLARRGTGRAGGSGSPANLRWGMTSITVDGRDVPDVSIGLQPGVTVTGRITLDGAAGGTPGPPNAQIALQPADSAMAVALGSQAVPIDRDGTFAFAGVVPSRYLIQARNVAGVGVKSVTAGGREVADVPIEIKPGENVIGVAITLSTLSTELSGVLQDPGGMPVTHYTVVVFAAERMYWTPLSRRIQAVQTATNGTYVVRNLPAGEYRIAVVDDIDAGAWHDPGFLEQLIPSSTPVTLGDGEHRVQNLRIGR